MNNFNINKNDLEQLEAILRNNRNIENIYQKLYTLELENKKDTAEYSKLLEYLRIVIEVEDSLYKKANLTIEKTLSWLKFLNNAKNLNNTILIRITNYLYQNLIKNYKELTKLPNKEIKNILDMSGITLTSNNNENKEEICKCIFIKETIMQDILYIFLSFLEEHINDQKEKIFRNELLVTKYNAIFINKNMETYPLKHNFELPDNPYIIFPLIRIINDVNETTCHNITNLLCNKIAINEIYELLELSDWDFNKKDKASSVITRECMLKSVLILMDDKNISDVNYVFHEYIEDKDYELIHPNNKISEITTRDLIEAKSIVKPTINNEELNKLKQFSM